MITVLEMTTGRWEIDGPASDIRPAPADRTALAHPYEALPPLQAGLGEYVNERPRLAGMPVHVATQDLDVFLAGAAR